MTVEDSLNVESYRSQLLAYNTAHSSWRRSQRCGDTSTASYRNRATGEEVRRCEGSMSRLPARGNNCALSFRNDETKLEEKRPKTESRIRELK